MVSFTTVCCFIIIPTLINNYEQNLNLFRSCNITLYIRLIRDRFLVLGFVIYQLKDPDATQLPLEKDFFKYNSSAARSKTYINSREITSRFKLNPGPYIIIPTTFQPDQEGDFILRIFSEKMAKIEKLC